jgi:PLP dependent protein
MTAARAIAANVRSVLAELPDGVTLVAAVKTRTADEVRACVDAGVRAIGHNYVQEAERMRSALGPAASAAQWHLIGHLQRNKCRAAVALFDLVETVDSLSLAVELDRRAALAGRCLPVLIEVNIAHEEQKAGVAPDEVEALARQLANLPNLSCQGLMTMGPFAGEPEASRPYFRAAREAFQHVRGLGLDRVEMRCLSMGMSNSYRIALEEGATAVRLGTRLFGPRPGTPS